MKKVLTILLCLIYIVNSTIYPSAASINAPDTTSQNIIIMDVDTNQILYSKNADEKIYPASTTKIMTILLAIESGLSMDTVLTVDRSLFEDEITDDDSQLYLSDGEQITLRDALYSAGVASANDVCYLIAVAVSGSVEAFVDRMNERAQELGATDTHFENPNGLHDDNHYSTPYDMCLIMQEGIKYDTFNDILSTTQYTIAPTQYQSEQRILNSSTLTLFSYSIYYVDGIVCSKIGYTSEARGTQISYATRDGKNLIAASFGGSGGETRYSETKELFDYAFENYEYMDVNQDYLDPNFDLPLFYDLEDTENYYYYEELTILYTYSDLDAYPVSRVFEPLELDSDSKAGDLAGYYCYKQNGEVIYKQRVYLNTNIYFHMTIKSLLTIIAVGLVTTFLIFVVLAYLTRQVMIKIKRFRYSH